MAKSTITRIWMGGLIVGVAGLLVAGGGTGLMLALGGTFSWSGHDVTGFTPTYDAAFWSGVALICIGGVGLVSGAITQFAAWIGALFNTYRLEDKVWFVLLLALGLLRFEFVIMVVYLLVGPDGTRQPSRGAPPGAPVAVTG